MNFILQRRKPFYINEKECVMEMWMKDCPISEDYPIGKRFSYTFVVDNQRMLGYDNAESKGIHKHVWDGKRLLEFPEYETDLWNLLIRFKREVGELRKILEGDKHDETRIGFDK